MSLEESTVSSMCDIVAIVEVLERLGCSLRWSIARRKGRRTEYARGRADTAGSRAAGAWRLPKPIGTDQCDAAPSWRDPLFAAACRCQDEKYCRRVKCPAATLTAVIDDLVRKH